MKYLVFLFVVLFTVLQATAGERRAYVQVGTRNVNGYRVIIMEDVTPRTYRPITYWSRSLRPPYNPLFDGPRYFPYMPTSHRSSTYVAPKVSKPEYIKNPFAPVDSEFFRALDEAYK